MRPRNADVVTAINLAVGSLAANRAVFRFRLRRFIEELGFVVLSICAHSQTFRDAINEDLQPDWNAKYAIIQEYAYSLELFGRIRGLDWKRPLHAHDASLDILAKNVLGGQLKGHDIPRPRGEVLGIQDGDLNERHNLSGGNSIPHLKILAAGQTSATDCRIKYNVTKDSVRAVPRIGRVGDTADVLQEDIIESVVLPRYRWPLMTQWPVEDPRYSGFDGDACVVCESESDFITKSWKKSGKIYTPPCQCTFAELQEKNEHPATPLLELISTARTGTGVRALQDIARNQYLGIYIGETIPQGKERWKIPA